jgi:hypothetical protein
MQFFSFQIVLTVILFLFKTVITATEEQIYKYPLFYLLFFSSSSLMLRCVQEMQAQSTSNTL